MQETQLREKQRAELRRINDLADAEAEAEAINLEVAALIHFHFL
jgi:hypothetical protein